MIKQIEISLLSLEFFCFCFCYCFNAVDNIIINQNYKKKNAIYIPHIAVFYITVFKKSSPLSFFQVSSKNKPQLRIYLLSVDNNIYMRERWNGTYLLCVCVFFSSLSLSLFYMWYFEILKLIYKSNRSIHNYCSLNYQLLMNHSMKF